MRNIGHLFECKEFFFSQRDAVSVPDYKVDAVFHLASPAAPGDINRLKEETLSANTNGINQLIQITPKFLFVSSMIVLGDCNRVQPYIWGKRYGEEICFRNTAKIARLGSVYGPGMRIDDSRVIPVFIRRALAGETLSVWNVGTQKDSFCYIGIY